MAIEERATQPRTVTDGKLLHEEWLRDEAQRQGFALYHKWRAPTRYGLSIGEAHRFLAVVVVATPCALLIAIPVAVIGAISLSARRGIIIKNPGACC